MKTTYYKESDDNAKVELQFPLSVCNKLKKCCLYMSV